MTGRHAVKNQASVAELMELIEAAERAAKRIHQSENGWPKAQFLPPFFKSRRAGIACEGERILGPSQTFVFVKGSGPWLGEDGGLYWMIGSSGTTFYRRSLDTLEQIYTSKGVRKAVDRLNVLEY